jgi:hypothetical protein
MELVKTYLRVFQFSTDGLGRKQIDFGVNTGDMFMPFRVVVFSAVDGTPTMYDNPANYSALEHVNKLSGYLNYPERLNVSVFGFDLRYYGVPGSYFLLAGTIPDVDLQAAITESRCFVLSYMYCSVRTMKYDGSLSTLGVDMSFDTNQTNYVAPPYVPAPVPPNNAVFDDGEIIYPYVAKT